MYISALGTATPPARYTKAQCWESFRASTWFERLSPRSRAITRTVLMGNNGIETRHLALERVEDAFAIDADTLTRRFATAAPELAARAASRALARASLRPDEIDAIVVSTCTGYLCPGLPGYVAERLGLRDDIAAFDLVGQGCGAALPTLDLACALLARERAKRVLAVCVEVSSAAMHARHAPRTPMHPRTRGRRCDATGARGRARAAGRHTYGG